MISSGNNWACAHYVMVSKFQWKPFCLATQRDPQNDWTATQNGVNYDVFAQAPSSLQVATATLNWHKQNSEVIKESVWNFEAQLEEDIDQDSGFVTEVMQPERWINKTIAGRKTLLLKKNEASESESEHSPFIWGFHWVIFTMTLFSS